MKRISVLLVVVLITGVMLTALGVLIIRGGSVVALGTGIEDGRPILLPPYYDAIVAGVLMTVSGSIAVGVSLTLMIMLRLLRYIESEPGLN